MREYTHIDGEGRTWKTYEYPKLTSSFVRALDRRDLLASAKYHRSIQKDKDQPGPRRAYHGTRAKPLQRELMRRMGSSPQATINAIDAVTEVEVDRWRVRWIGRQHKSISKYVEEVV